MNSLLSPLPTQREPIGTDDVRWFIGYMPVAKENPSVSVGGYPLPPLPDFSVSPSWAASTDMAFAVNPFRGDDRGNRVEVSESRHEIPGLPLDECVPYTDEDLHEVLADLMVSEEDIQTLEPKVPGDMAPMLRSASRRAVAEMVDPLFLADVPLSLGRVCDGIKAMFARWSSHRSKRVAARVRQVVGLQLFHKVSTDLVVSTGDIPMAAEDGILRALRDTAAHSNDPVFIAACTQIHFIQGKAHVLAAIIQGEPDEAMLEDLAYLLRRIEMRIDKRPSAADAWVTDVRSVLQEGLLIRSPMTTAFENRVDAM